MQTAFHNPNLKQINFLDERFYSEDDKTFYPSVTTVLGVYPKGKGFDEWLKKTGAMAEEVATVAADQGTIVHDTIQRLMQGEEIFWADGNGRAMFSKNEWMMIMRFRDFFTRYNPKIITVEQKLISHKYKIGMTMDFICELEGLRWLIDHKTSKYVHPSHELQVAAYATAWNDVFPEMRVDRVGILHLAAQTRGEDKSGKSIQGKSWKLVTEKDFGRPYYDAFRVYEHTRAIWDEENPNYKPLNLIYPDRLKLSLPETPQPQSSL